jgi:hypothetical protein
MYITSQTPEEYEYTDHSETQTLGDLGDDELNRIQAEIGLGNDEDIKYTENGFEVHMAVTNVKPIINK